MIDQFLFIGLPYIALIVMIAGSIARYRTQRFSYSAQGSQFLESRQLRWASLPFHVGILIIAVGHIIPFLAPGLWQAITSVPVLLITLEVVGVVAAFLALAGLVLLLYRRVSSSKVEAVTNTGDLVLLVLLVAQVLVGIGVATGFRWGAAWSTNTTTPYLWSLVTLRPEPEYVTGLPPTIKLHLVLAWVIFLVVPFTRLVHVFSIPIAYLWRPPQKVVWSTPRAIHRADHPARPALDSRRYFLRGSVGAAAAFVLLGAGVMDKFIGFFRGPSMTVEEEADLLRKKLERLEMAAAERELEIERMEKQYIFVARLAELSNLDGKYFIDYHMRPALAFKDENGLPLLISAKCTHLGCTVASTIDNGRILCPCHVSWFDVKSGIPEPGSPAKAPLPHIGWVLMDPQGNLVASQGPTGALQGEFDPAQANLYSVYIARKFEELA